MHRAGLSASAELLVLQFREELVLCNLWQISNFVGLTSGRWMSAPVELNAAISVTPLQHYKKRCRCDRKDVSQT